MADRVIKCLFVGYTKYNEGACYDIMHPESRNIYQSRDITWSKRMYYKKKLYEDNEDLLPLPQEYDNNNDEKYDDAKVYITDTDEMS